MPPINPRLLLILFAFVLSGFSSGARADECSEFVRRSVQQQDKNLFNLCGYRGSHWSSSTKNLLRECRVMSKRDRKRRLAIRSKALALCPNINNSSVGFTNFGRNRQQQLMSVLIRAIRLGSGNLVRSVLNAGVNLRAQPSLLGASPLFVAVELGNYHIARILIRAGAKPYLLASGEVNLISLMLKGGPTNYAFLEFLLQNKANPNSVGNNVVAEYPLVLAALKSDFRSVDLLLRYRADTNLYHEFPAIQKAVMSDHFPVVRALMRKGANPNLGTGGKVCKGRMALDIAYRFASERVIDLLLDNRALTEFECKRAAMRRLKVQRRASKPQSRNR